MGRRAAISIGVSKAGDLPTLEAAVPDARRFADWARANRYDDVRLIHDDDGPVRVAQVIEAVEQVIEHDLERLLLFFSGHGTSSGVADYWLLSNFHRNSNEAINVLASVNNAKRLPIPQIAVFADACRSAIPLLAHVTGSVIFPMASQPSEIRPKWDQFFATRLGEIAQEVPGAADLKAFGVFSKCLFRALSGAERSILQPRHAPRPLQVLCSDKLADWIDQIVPEESGRIPGARVQFPDTATGWRDPNDIYLELEPPAASEEPSVLARTVARSRGADLSSRALAPPPSETRLSHAVELGRLARGAARLAPRRAPTAPARTRGSTAAKQRVEQAQSALNERIRGAGKTVQLSGRHSFETRRGLTIHGGRIVEAVSGRTPVDLFEEDGLSHVRGHQNDAQTVILRTQEDTWVATVILPGFNGIITLDQGAAAAFNYFPLGAAVDPEDERLIRRWTGLMSVGQAPRGELEELGASIRYGKHRNPALGILAAYAYDRAGALEEIDSIAGYFADRGQPVPFDVAMLSTFCTRRADDRAIFTDGVVHEGAKLDATVAGTFPLMARGWATLDPKDPIVHPELAGLCPGLVPSLWTTLRLEPGKRLAKLIAAGEL